jgi:hypothetical protein
VSNFGNVNLIQGRTYDFSSITLGNNATVTLIEDGGGSIHANAWTIIGCSGNWALSTGASFEFYVADGVNADDDSSPLSITAVAPDGTLLSYSPDAVMGGSGQDSGAPRPGGLQGFGNGGGGGGTGGTSGLGGDGTYELSGFGGGLGGADGVEPYGNTGNFAASATNGGSGGSRGYSGSCLYLNIRGSRSFSGTSNMNAPGQVGGDGGNGNTTGGGGGGGGGGFGGKIVIKNPSGTLPFGSADVTGALGGVGGQGNLGFFGDDGIQGQDGSIVLITG